MNEPIRTPLIVHVVYRFATGGLENGLVNLVNSMPRGLARHRIVALVGVDPAFAARVNTDNCEVEDLGGNPTQQTLRLLPSLYRRFRALKPALVHTRNISTIECQYAAWLARVKHRVHGEHGWDETDQYGTNKRYTQLRRVTRHIVDREVALSKKTSHYLQTKVGIPASMIREIPNGVDTKHFTPVAIASSEPTPRDWPFSGEHFIVGTVGRLSGIKNQALLCEAFCQLRDQHPEFKVRARLIIVGEGPDKRRLQEIITKRLAADAVWFAGDRIDIPLLLRHMDLFCQPSKAEGLSNSILEAMATGLPIVATDVGGNSEQIQNNISGKLVKSEDPSLMASAIRCYFDSAELRGTHGKAARLRVEANFSLQSMVAAYTNMYRELVSMPGKGGSPTVLTEQQE